MPTYRSSPRAGACIVPLEPASQDPHVRRLFASRAGKHADIRQPTPALFCDAFTKYTWHPARSGKEVHILAQRLVTDAQLAHVRDVLAACVAPSSLCDKDAMLDEMAHAGAVICVFNSERERRRSRACRRFAKLRLCDQNLYRDEVIVSGSAEHARGERDATWEEVLHNVQNFALRAACPQVQRELDLALAAALGAGTYFPDPDYLSLEIVTQEYFALGAEAYFGMWEHLKPGQVAGGELTLYSRALLVDGDPALHALVAGFFPGVTPVLPPGGCRQAGCQPASRVAKRGDSCRRYWAAVLQLRNFMQFADPPACNALLAALAGLLLGTTGAAAAFCPRRASRHTKVRWDAVELRHQLALLGRTTAAPAETIVALRRAVRLVGPPTTADQEGEMRRAARGFHWAYNAARVRLAGSSPRAPLNAAETKAFRRAFESVRCVQLGNPCDLDAGGLRDLCQVLELAEDHPNPLEMFARGGASDVSVEDFVAQVTHMLRHPRGWSGSGSGDSSRGSGSSRSSGSSRGNRRSRSSRGSRRSRSSRGSGSSWDSRGSAKGHGKGRKGEGRDRAGAR